MITQTAHRNQVLSASWLKSQKIWAGMDFFTSRDLEKNLKNNFKPFF